MQNKEIASQKLSGFCQHGDTDIIVWEVLNFF